jgi:putative ABC transport system permease protein
VTGDFFGAMGVRLLRGRLFQAADFGPGPRVTIVNESLARQHLAGVDPIGQRIAARPGEWFEIVGVVADVKYDRLDGGVALQAYAPFTRAPADWGDLTLVVRARPAAGLEDKLRAAIHAVDGGQAITRLRPASDWIAASLARQRFTMVLFAAFAAAALLLAAVGIYGLIAYTVTRRTAEIGIRLALGAHPGDVFGLVFEQAGRLVALGLAAGLAGAFVLTRLLSTLLFGVSPHDPLTFGAIALLVCLVAALACLLPARRAIRVDPMIALRAD